MAQYIVFIMKYYVVLIVDEKVPLNEWLIGKVDKVYPGKNGLYESSMYSGKKGWRKQAISFKTTFVSHQLI